ncbi:MAG: hypothetical protein U0X91_31045 [Spirosomataceae bacterium]
MLSKVFIVGNFLEFKQEMATIPDRNTPQEQGAKCPNPILIEFQQGLDNIFALIIEKDDQGKNNDEVHH